MPTILNRSIGPSGWNVKISQYLAQLADRSEAAAGSAFSSPMIETRIKLLRDTAAYARDLDLTDPRLVALMTLHGNADEFEPLGDTQSMVLTNVGLTGGGVEANDVFNDLLLGAVEDAQTVRSTERKGLQEQLARATTQSEQTETLTKELEAAREELAQARERAAELGNVEQERDDLRELLAAIKPSASPGKREQPRRQAVPDNPGVYAAERADGTKYEVTFLERQPDGTEKRRWVTVGTDLDEAVREHARLLDAESKRRDAVAA